MYFHYIPLRLPQTGASARRSATAKLVINFEILIYYAEKNKFKLKITPPAGSTGKCKISDLFEKPGLWVRKTEFFARSEVQFLCDVLHILVRDVVEV